MRTLKQNFLAKVKKIVRAKQKFLARAKSKIRAKQKLLQEQLRLELPNEWLKIKFESYDEVSLNKINFRVFRQNPVNKNYEFYKAYSYTDLTKSLDYDTRHVDRDKESTGLSHGDYVFSCYMYPLVFDKYTYGGSDFVSTEGSPHSIDHCGCRAISPVYARWFLDNNICDLFDSDEDNLSAWDDYELQVRKLCFRDGIKYEGY